MNRDRVGLLFQWVNELANTELLSSSTGFPNALNLYFRPHVYSVAANLIIAIHSLPNDDISIVTYFFEAQYVKALLKKTKYPVSDLLLVT